MSTEKRKRSTHLGRSQQQHGGPLEHLSGGGDLRPPPFVFQVVLPFARQVRQLDHFGAEVAERLDELREVIDAFQTAQTSRHLKSKAPAACTLRTFVD